MVPMSARMEGNGSWLCPTERDRERLLDHNGRAARTRLVSSVAIAVALVVSVPWLGWEPLLLLVASSVNLITIDRRLARSARPESVSALSVLVTQLIVGGSIAVTGGPHSPLLGWIAIPTITAAIRFRRQVVVCFMASAGLITLAATVPIDPGGFANGPAYVIATAALIISVTTVGMQLMSSELKHREESVLDPLTGLLNRKALASRFLELEQVATQSEASVCVIAADLDHFKLVNDSHGHQRGDDVLRDVTYEMRKRLRTFELMYRLGGEEFLIVLPGVDLAEGMQVAERLREGVEECNPAGLAQTISMGVAAASGADVTYDGLVGMADRALYDAKEAGRNKVRAAGHDDLVPTLEALDIALA
jgi:diguanylate cyclase (GGDEF)-like protein